MADEDEIPEICRKEVIEWDREITRLGELLAELLCEGLGVEAKSLKEMTCFEGRVMVGHYYPYCPQPDLTVGLAYHTDPGVLTVVQQDHVGGLQVKYGGGWVDVKPVPGALVINIGDLLQVKIILILFPFVST
jgi:isopenicillin N synthase-like dioxygenase